MKARSGFVLIYSLLVVLTGAALTGGMLALAWREALIARRYVEVARARAAAEGEVRKVFQSWSTPAYADLLPGQDQAVATLDTLTTATVTRLDTALFVISATATVRVGPAPPVVAHAGMIVGTLRPLPPEAGAAAVVASSRVILRGGLVSGRDVCHEAAPAPAVIAPAVEEIGAVLEGNPAVEVRTPPPITPGSALDPAIAAAVATIRAVGPSVAPRPRAAADACEPGPDNWGALSEAHPCGDIQPLIYSPADLTVEGGEGRGVLVVDGDLVLQGGFQFRGVILVTGEVFVGPGTRIRGSLHAEIVRIEDAEILRDACAMEKALSAPAMNRGYRPGERWWIPVF